jgi:hypothetical protein
MDFTSKVVTIDCFRCLTVDKSMASNYCFASDSADVDLVVDVITLAGGYSSFRRILFNPLGCHEPFFLFTSFMVRDLASRRSRTRHVTNLKQSLLRLRFLCGVCMDSLFTAETFMLHEDYGFDDDS